MMKRQPCEAGGELLKRRAATEDHYFVEPMLRGIRSSEQFTQMGYAAATAQVTGINGDFQSLTRRRLTRQCFRHYV